MNTKSREDKSGSVKRVETKKKTRKNLYALLVGITDYDETIILEESVAFPKLSGCVKDAGKMKDYLESDDSFKPHIKILANRQATKKAIVSQVKEHLARQKRERWRCFITRGMVHGNGPIGMPGNRRRMGG